MNRQMISKTYNKAWKSRSITSLRFQTFWRCKLATQYWWHETKTVVWRSMDHRLLMAFRSNLYLGLIIIRGNRGWDFNLTRWKFFRSLWRWLGMVGIFCFSIFCSYQRILIAVIKQKVQYFRKKITSGETEK